MFGGREIERADNRNYIVMKSRTQDVSQQYVVYDKKQLQNPCKQPPLKLSKI